MGRRSLKAERREQILEAFERCVVEHGMAGATLERVAEYAGLGRPAIRHNVGNREALIDAALDRIVARHEAHYASISDALPARGRVEALLGYLFTGPFSGEADEEDAVLDELFALRHRDAHIEARLRAVYEGLHATLEAEVRSEHADAPRREVRRVAYLIMCLAFGHSTFSGLGVGVRRGKQGLEAAKLLLSTL